MNQLNDQTKELMAISGDHAAHLRSIHFVLISVTVIMFIATLFPSTNRTELAIQQLSVFQQAQRLGLENFVEASLGGNPFDDRLPIEFTIETNDALFGDAEFLEISWPETVLAFPDQCVELEESGFDSRMGFSPISEVRDIGIFIDRLMSLRQYYFNERHPIRLVQRRTLEEPGLEIFDKEAQYDRSLGPYVYLFCNKAIGPFDYPHALVRLRTIGSSDGDWHGILNLEDEFRSELVGFALLNSYLQSSGAAPIRVGSFEIEYAELFEETKDIDTLSLDQAAKYLKKKRVSERSLSLVGIEISYADLGRLGLPILLVVQAYFAIHLIQFSRLTNSLSIPVSYPWLALYNFKTARAGTMISVVGFPLFLALSFGLQNIGAEISTLLPLGIMLLLHLVLGGVLAVLLTRLHRLRPQDLD